MLANSGQCTCKLCLPSQKILGNVPVSCACHLRKFLAAGCFPVNYLPKCFHQKAECFMEIHVAPLLVCILYQLNRIVLTS